MSNSHIHNKKRNCILMYEFLVRTISRAFLDNDKKRQQTALKIIKKCFKPGTELYKEFRLANALYKTSVTTPIIASSILVEAKTHAKKIDIHKLQQEKSILIREVNHNLNDDSFYDQSINDYRILATIQSLFNEWRNDSIDIEKQATYEDHVINWLTVNKQNVVSESTELDAGTTRIVAKLINQKFNEKYADTLNSEQRAIVRSFVLSETSDDCSIKQHLIDIRTRLLDKLQSVVTLHESKISDKLLEVKATLLAENLDNIDVETVTRFLLYSRLINELEDVGEKHV